MTSMIERQTDAQSELIEKIRGELWVMRQVGIHHRHTLPSVEVQDIKVPVYFTIGELRLMLKQLGGKEP